MSEIARLTKLLIIGTALLAGLMSAPAHARSGDSLLRLAYQNHGTAVIGEIDPDRLPVEARNTLQLIKKGGPFPYARDGAAFGNRERMLPRQERGYYREYTVPTPDIRSRGPRRIVAGRPGEFYYTDDHYRSFRRIMGVATAKE